jgi:hypothetical protein
MKWHTVDLVDAVVTASLVLGVLLLALALGGCAVQCEAQAQEKYGLWCNKPQPLPSASTLTPETSQFPTARLAKRGSN